MLHQGQRDGYNTADIEYIEDQKVRAASAKKPKSQIIMVAWCTKMVVKGRGFSELDWGLWMSHQIAAR